jgi:CDP-diacylglycerol--glycerol-3-phosphate 3-phosphatidyltransferase
MKDAKDVPELNPAASRLKALRLKKVNLPNQLTLLRVLLVPVFYFLFTADSLVAQWCSLAAFIGASITDYYDGKIARLRRMETAFGKVMDPLADKLLMMTALVSLVQIGMVPAWMVVLILWREFAVTGLRTLAAVRQKVMAADFWGKLKTVAQMVAVTTCLVLVVVQNTLNTISATWMDTLQAAGNFGDWAAFLLNTNALPYWMMCIAAFWSLYSGVNYFLVNWEMIREELENE